VARAVAHPDGASRSKTFDREFDAEQHLVSVQHQALSGTYVDASAGNVTVESYSKTWLARQVRRPATEAAHASYLKQHVIPFLGARRLRDVRPGDIQAWARHRSEVLSPSTLQNVYRFVGGLFAAAVDDRLIPVTPCVGVKLPDTPEVEVRPFEPAQIRVIADAVEPRWQAMVVAAAALGMRQGELLGLTLDASTSCDARSGSIARWSLSRTESRSWAPLRRRGRSGPSRPHSSPLTP